MKTTPQKTGAATPVETDRFDKKKVNTRVSPVINFQIGIIAALVLAFLIIELTSATTTTKVNSKTVRITDLDPEETNFTEYVIVSNQPEKVKTATVEQKVEIVPDDKPEPIEDPIEDPIPTEKPATPTETKISEKPATDSKTIGKPATKSKAPITTGIYGLNEMAIFPGCKERYDNEERKHCFNKRIYRFVNRHFNTDLASELGLEPGSKVKIQMYFIIDTHGKAKDIQVKASHPELEKEAYRVINRLPTIIPGKVAGEAVNMEFSLPIIFNIQ